MEPQWLNLAIILENILGGANVLKKALVEGGGVSERQDISNFLFLTPLGGPFFPKMVVGFSIKIGVLLKLKKPPK